jgi:diguanylate cyclase (GGDEF)-like protein/PAS domain S-box-containing protein
LWARPDFQSLAFGRQGEVLAAKVRLGIMALVTMIPLESVLLRPPDPEARIGLGAAIAVFALGALVLRVAQRPAPPAWLGLFTCLLDVTTVSAINAGFVLAGNPLAATNSRVVFCCYFVALAMVGLRQDRRWCLVAALAAMAEYGGIVLWAAVRYDLGGPAFARSGYGTFNWDNQAGRLILLAAAGAIGTVIVVQGRGYWGAVIRYLDAFPLSVLITGPDGRSQYANRAARELLGRPLPAGTDSAELAAQSFLAGTGRPYPPERGAIARALAGEPTASDDLEIQRPDARIAVAVWGTPILDARGRVTNAIAVFHDETRRRHLEQMLRDANAELELRGAILEAVAAAAERLFQAASWEEVATEALGGIGGAVGVSRVSFFQVSELEDGELAAQLRFGWVAPGVAPLAEEARQQAGFRSSGFGRWLESFGRGETVHGPVRGFPAGERAALARQRVLSLAVVPVRLGGRLGGFLGFDDCQAERVWSQVELLALRVAADTLGAAIAGKERAAAVAASEERYRALFEQSLGLLCTHALDGMLLTVNCAAAAALGLSPDRMVGHNLGEFLAPTVRGQLRDYLAAIAAEGDMSGTMILLHDAGGERVWQYRNQLVRVPGQEPYVVGHALDVTERTRLERVLREQALTDPLTGLANRALFEDRLRRALERARREAAVQAEMPPLALVYLDLDGFKEVNDRRGHAAGDALLREVGSRLREGVRTLDTVARLGGDEFALILPDIGSAANARRLVEKLLERLRNPFLHDGAALAVSVSLGVGMLPGDGDSAEILTARADRAMYAAKAAGGNGYRFSGEGGDAGKGGEAGERGPGERGPGEGAAW